MALSTCHVNHDIAVYMKAASHYYACDNIADPLATFIKGRSREGAKGQFSPLPFFSGRAWHLIMYFCIFHPPPFQNHGSATAHSTVQQWHVYPQEAKVAKWQRTNESKNTHHSAIIVVGYMNKVSLWALDEASEKRTVSSNWVSTLPIREHVRKEHSLMLCACNTVGTHPSYLILRLWRFPINMPQSWCQKYH